MARFQVIADSENLSTGRFIGPGMDIPVMLGRGGVTAAQHKREGDGKTPLGRYPLRYVFYRPDRLAEPISGLPVRPLAPDLGWCDAADQPQYNQLVHLPFGPSHEKLWRDDHVYDLLIVIGHNDAPVVADLGSAIFLHLQRPDGRPTEGCVAFQPEDMLAFLRLAHRQDHIQLIIK